MMVQSYQSSKEEKAIVRCADCGFLQVKRPKSDSYSFEDVPRLRRDSPDPQWLYCFKQVLSFGEKSHLDHRECDAFRKWNPGLSAKEHVMLEELRDQQRRQARLTILLSLLTTGAVVLMGLLNYFGK